jgi:hypothetical protein
MKNKSLLRNMEEKKKNKEKPKNKMCHGYGSKVT